MKEVTDPESFFRPIIDHLDRQGGEGPFGLTTHKIRTRAEPVFEHADPDILVFEMERHRPVLGETHFPGHLMEAMVVRQNRYGYDARKDEILDLGLVGAATLEVEVDWLIDQHTDGVMFMIERGDEGSIIIEESTYGEPAEIADLAEAEAYAVRIVESLSLDDVFIGLCNEVSVAPEEISRVEEEFIEALKHRFAEAARDSWRDYELSGDFDD